MKTYDKATLENLIDGNLAWPEMQGIISSEKDPDRFEKILDILQARVKFKEKILLPLSEHLYIVQKGNERIIKCDCGHEFCDYRENWKTKSRVILRDTKEKLDELYPSLMHANPDWSELREFYCPGCFTLLENECVPPGYPVIHDFVPDLDAFYEKWVSKK